MAFENTDILFAALVGSRFGGDPAKFKIIQDEMAKHVKFPTPFLPFHVPTFVYPVAGEEREDNNRATPPRPEAEQFFPFTFSGDDGERYLLPYEPMINISGRNVIVRRDIAKAKTESGTELGGTVKERWTRGDYEITITGALHGSLLTGSVEDCFPREDFEKLRDYMTSAKSLTVYCEPLQLLGIDQIVIEDFSWPFTKGENVQAYEIKAYSDYDYKLLLDIND
ncbi:MAG: hypothetical protein JJE55_08270 [Flavobacteriaceae bacterium]|nr:hypothetical protein [Flavobacteriaceae bacterium]